MSLDILSDDPDKLLNEWLGELENLIGGLEISTNAATITSVTQLGATIRPLSQTSTQDRTDSYRFSMANLEETHEAELDAILGELSLLEQRNTSKSHHQHNNSVSSNNNNNNNMHNDSIVELRQTRRGSHSRSNSTLSGLTNSTISTISSVESGAVDCEKESTISIPIITREPRTESPDNDSAFSDTVSLLSSESSASSGVGTTHMKNLPNLSQCDSAKAAKIHLALQKLEQASVRRLFVKAFSADGASKSLLVDERMTCGHVQRLLADKNHVQMEPHWSLVEHLTDLNMERLYEDHELLVDSLMLWSRDSKNRVLFLQRPDKVDLFNMPERYFTNIQMAPGSDHDEHTRSILLEEFFNNGGQVAMEGPLYLKTDSRKGWKRYHFVLRASGLYYFPKEKTKSTKDLVCLSSFVGYEVYRGIGWKKKHKSPTDYTFALKSPNLPMNSKNVRFVKMLCAEDAETLEKWVTLIRIAKHGKKILENHRQLLEDLARDEIDKLSSARSGSIGSIVSSVPSQISTGSAGLAVSSIQNGRLSRASSSSSSGCLSDDNNGFDSEFPTGTIKRKPSMKPNLPLTSMTRQLKEVGETTLASEDSNPTSPERGGTLTRRHSRRRSEESTGSNGTLKRRQSSRGSIESVNSTPSSSTPTPSNPGTPSGMGRQVFNLNVVSSNSSLNSTGITSPLETMPSCMTDSIFSLPPPPDDLGASLSASLMSLDSLPPPPPASELVHDFSGSQISLVSLPPPPPPLEVQTIFVPAPIVEPIPEVVEEIPPPPSATTTTVHLVRHSSPIHTPAQPIYVSKSIKSPTGVLKSPPYKNPPPPPYNGGSHTLPLPPPPSTKSVTFADSPVLLRRKVCFEDEVQLYANTPNIKSVVSRESIAPVPPPRAEATRLSVTSPKRLTDSASNPPRDFLKDLQKVMRKKWQVAQKCKLEPATTPHEVLGFRDFNELTQVTNSSNFYSDSGNVSNWVQEHYGQNSLYENLGSNKNSSNSNNIVVPSTESVLPPRIQSTPPNSITKKRPPPPPPKRSESTQLTTSRSQI